MPPVKYIRKVRELREKLWPDVQFKKRLWHRKRNDGFTTIPRTMPLIVNIIDDLTKGAPAGLTYMELWCRSYDEMYVSLSRSKELAFNSGFTGQRAERTWAEKIRRLADLGFIKVKDGQAGQLSHALILNPYLVIKELHAAGNPGVSQQNYNALVERAIEIGAADLDDDYLDDDDDKGTDKTAAKTAATSPEKATSKPAAAPKPPPAAPLKVATRKKAEKSSA